MTEQDPIDDGKRMSNSSLRPFPPDGPDCPECGGDLVEQSGGGMRTLAATQSGYGDDGEYHSHDPNWNKSTYICENGHRVRRETQSSCPAKGCDYGGEVRMSVLNDE